VSGTARYYLRTPDGMLIGTSQGSTHHYYLRDGEMNIVGLTNSSGTATAYYTYDPYGAHPTATGTDAALNNYRYKSGWLNNSDIYKFGARYYHASDARWTQQDPIAGTITNAATINRYNYSGSDPVDRSDPSGRDWCPTTWDLHGECASARLNMIAAMAAVTAAVFTAETGVGVILVISAAALYASAAISEKNACFG
jgi:RHS repeat-associated protein